ncbi:MAG: hypothetical protein QXO97_10255 [Candidatus Nezhaarchaeales archaeon]
MSTITIELLDANSIGRYYQLAALSTGYVQPRISSTLRDKLEKGVEQGVLQLDMNEVQLLFNSVADYLDNYVCKTKPNYSPILYKAGRYDDKSILRNAGIQIGKTLQCVDIANYLKQNIYQFLTNKVPTPTFLKAYVYSYYRERVKVKDISVASLSLALAGVYISTMGYIRKGGEQFEVSAIPDSSVDTLKDAHRFFALLNEPKSNVKVSDLIQSILDLEGISLELSALIATGIYVYSVAYYVYNLPSLSSYYNIFERFRLVCITPQKGLVKGRIQFLRPVVLWERPLTLTHIMRTLETAKALDILSYTERLASYSPQISGELREYPEAVSACVNDLYEYLETGSFDALVHCSGGVARLYDLLDDLCRRKNLNQACTILKTVRDFAGCLSRLI